MKAIIFAAGLGTRLQPLTDNCPKALININNKPLLWYAIEKTARAGATKIVVNVHHFADQIIDYIKNNSWPVEIVISDERKKLLDTGGGLLFAKKHLQGDSPILAYNVDIISNINIHKLMVYHNNNKAIATLVVRKRETNRYFLFNNSMQLCGWQNNKTHERIIIKQQNQTLSELAFSGIQMLSSAIFDCISESGKFSITPMYLRIAQSEKIVGYPDKSSFWLDAGKPDQLSVAAGFLKDNPIF